MKKYKNWIIAANLIAIIAYFSFTIIQKENILKNGKLILLELSPIDPRSLMQGDYMQLRYSIADSLDTQEAALRGYIVVKVNEKSIAKGVRVQQYTTPLNNDEYLINYTKSNINNLNIGAESFFFQEGHAQRYESAKFGGIKVDNKGNSLLIGLYDEDEKLIK
ncbi:GDYXXLXY domain-containing protein [Sphingobacterium faecium]|uniref:GDYXXLXY domain-containing protein n=1 Tax=Sphingobacterium faecium TaxID=34087 RepID=UPI00320B3032